MAAVELVNAYVRALPGPTRRLATAEWGITVEAEPHAGETLEIGLRIAEGMLRAQAFAVPHHQRLDPWLLLHWNRQTRFVRFGTARGGDVWVHGDLPVVGLDERSVDRLLGLVAEGAAVARRYAAQAVAAASPG